MKNIVSKEVAIGLKELKCDLSSNHIYFVPFMDYKPQKESESKKLDYFRKNSPSQPHIVVAPNILDACMWIWKEFEFWISVDLIYFGNGFYYSIDSDENTINSDVLSAYESPLEAYNAALLKAIEIIKNK